MEFHCTQMGAKFFNSDVPRLIKGIEKIGTELERMNNLKEKESKDNDKQRS